MGRGKKKKSSNFDKKLSKKIARNHKYIAQHIDNFVTAKNEELSSATLRKVGGSATRNFSAMKNRQDEKLKLDHDSGVGGPSRDPPSAQSAFASDPELKLPPGRSGGGEPQLVYMVHNYYGGWNNHNYAAPEQQPHLKMMLQSPMSLHSAPKPLILAQNQPPDLSLYQNADSATKQLFAGQSLAVQLPQANPHAPLEELQNKKRQLMMREMPKNVNLKPLATLIPGRAKPHPHKQHVQRGSELMTCSDLDGDASTTLLQRSNSVDTDQFLSHLQSKATRYASLRSRDSDGSPVHKNLSKIERQMYLMEFMENAKIKNHFRTLKLHDLVDKKSLGARQELQKMLQQEEDWVTLSAMAHSDEEAGFVRARHVATKDINQFSKMILLNDHYKKLKQMKDAYGIDELERQKSKSHPRFSPSSPGQRKTFKKHKHGAVKKGQELVKYYLKRFRTQMAKEALKKSAKGRNHQQEIRLLKQESEERRKRSDYSSSQSSPSWSLERLPTRGLAGEKKCLEVPEKPRRSHIQIQENTASVKHPSCLSSSRDLADPELRDNFSASLQVPSLSVPRGPFDEQTLREAMDHYAKLIKQLKQQKCDQQLLAKDPFENEAVEVALQDDNQIQSDQRKVKGDDLRRSTQDWSDSTPAELLHTIQSNHLREQMQSSFNDDDSVSIVAQGDTYLNLALLKGWCTAGQDCSSSTFRTDTEFMNSLMTNSNNGNTPTSRIVAQQGPHLPTISEAPLELKLLEEQASSEETRSPAIAEEAKQNVRLHLPIEEPQATEPPLRQQPSIHLRNMFDIGSPSAGSGAGFEIDKDDSYLLNSSRRSLTSSQLAVSCKQLASEGFALAAAQNGEAAAQAAPEQSKKLEARKSEDSSKHLSLGRPPLLKMRTQVGRNEKMTQNLASVIEAKCHGSVGGGQIKSDQQSSFKQTWQAISVNQIPAVQNDSAGTTSVAPQMATVAEAVELGNPSQDKRIAGETDSGTDLKTSQQLSEQSSAPMNPEAILNMIKTKEALPQFSEGVTSLSGPDILQQSIGEILNERKNKRHLPFDLADSRQSKASRNENLSPQASVLEGSILTSHQQEVLPTGTQTLTDGQLTACQNQLQAMFDKLESKLLQSKLLRQKTPLSDLLEKEQAASRDKLVTVSTQTLTEAATQTQITLQQKDAGVQAQTIAASESPLLSDHTRQAVQEELPLAVRNATHMLQPHACLIETAQHACGHLSDQHSCAAGINQPKVIVGSPFEQEFSETVAVAGIQPHSQLMHPQLHVRDPDVPVKNKHSLCLPIASALKHESGRKSLSFKGSSSRSNHSLKLPATEDAMLQYSLFNGDRSPEDLLDVDSENEAIDLMPHDETILVEQKESRVVHPVIRVLEDGAAKQPSEDVSHCLSSFRASARQEDKDPVISIDGHDYKVAELLIMSDEEDDRNSATLDPKNPASVGAEITPHQRKAVPPLNFESRKEESKRLLKSCTAQEIAPGTAAFIEPNFQNYKFDSFGVSPMEASLRKASSQSLNFAPQPRKRDSKFLSYIQQRKGSLAPPANKSQVIEAVQPRFGFLRIATMRQCEATVRESLAEFESEKHKIFASFVDKIDLKATHEKEHAKEQVASDAEEQLINFMNGVEEVVNQDLNLRSARDSMWSVEVDDFGFENLKFQIITSKTIRECESKIQNQVIWNYKAREKALNRHITKKEVLQTQGSFFLRNPTPSAAEDLSMTQSRFGNQQERSVAEAHLQPSNQTFGGKHATFITSCLNAEDLHSMIEHTMPIPQTAEKLQLDKMTSTRTLLKISRELSEQAMLLKNELSLAQEQTLSSSRTGTLQKGRSFKKSTAKQYKAAFQMNKWASASIYFNDLKSRIILKNSAEDVDPFETEWFQVDNASYNQVSEEIQLRANFDKRDFLKKLAWPEEQAHYVQIFRNKRMLQSRLLSYPGLVTSPAENWWEKPMRRVKFQSSYMQHLMHLSGESAFTSYNQHLWRVTQIAKQVYVKQGDIAQRQLEKAVRHDDSGLKAVLQDYYHTIAAFMRRSTIRQEINDTLFQKKTQLLDDQEYVSLENRPILIEKMRRCIKSSCLFDSSDNVYQLHLRMKELDELSRQKAVQRTHLLMKREEPKSYTQFDKMLIFINFHPPDEKQRWIHQDYMDGLKLRDVCTTRYYGDVFNQLQKSRGCRTIDTLKGWSVERAETKCLPLTKSSQLIKFGSKKHTPNKKGSSTLNINQKCKGEAETESQRGDTDKDFPFKLNDYFGYRTLVLTDGCYQILVPARPECNPNAQQPLLPSNQLSAWQYYRLLTDGKNNSEEVPLEDDASPVSFAQKWRREGKDVSFSRSSLQNNNLSSVHGPPPHFAGQENLQQSRLFDEQKLPRYHNSDPSPIELDQSDSFVSSVDSLSPRIRGAELKRDFSASIQGPHISVGEGLLRGPGNIFPQTKLQKDKQVVIKVNEEEEQQNFFGVVKVETKRANSHSSESVGEALLQKAKTIRFKTLNEPQRSHSGAIMPQKSPSLLQTKKMQVPLKQRRAEEFSQKHDDLSSGSSAMEEFSISLSDQEEEEEARNEKCKEQPNKVPVSEPCDTSFALQQHRSQLRRNSEDMSDCSIASVQEPANLQNLQFESTKAAEGGKTRVRDVKNETQMLFRQNSFFNRAPIDLVRVRNISREKIKTVEALQNVKISQSDRRLLHKWGLKPTQHAQHHNLSTSHGSSPSVKQGSSRQKKTQVGLRSKKIVIVKRQDHAADELKISPSLPRSPFTDQDASKNVEASCVSQAPKLRCLQLELKNISHSLSDFVKKEAITPARKPSQNNSARVKNITKSEVYKFQVSRSKSPVALLDLKSPKTRMWEKKQFEARLKEQERNKVFTAIEQHQILVVEDYVKRHQLGTNITDDYGNTLLSMAVQYGCYEICNLLLKEGANVNTQNHLGNTPLHYAIAFNMSNIGDLLIDSGANESLKNKKRLTPWQGI